MGRDDGGADFAQHYVQSIDALQAYVGRFARRDIFKNSDKIRGFGVVADHGGDQVDPDRFAVLTPILRFCGVRRLSAGQHRLPCGLRWGTAIGKAEVGKCLLAQFFVGKPEHGTKPFVHAAKLTISGNMGDPDGGLVKGGTETRFTFLQRNFSKLAFGDVDVGDDCTIASIRAQWRDRQQEPTPFIWRVTGILVSEILQLAFQHLAKTSGYRLGTGRLLIVNPLAYH